MHYPTVNACILHYPPVIIRSTLPTRAQCGCSSLTPLLTPHPKSRRWRLEERVGLRMWRQPCVCGWGGEGMSLWSRLRRSRVSLLAIWLLPALHEEGQGTACHPSSREVDDSAGTPAFLVVYMATRRRGWRHDIKTTQHDGLMASSLLTVPNSETPKLTQSSSIT